MGYMFKILKILQKYTIFTNSKRTYNCYRKKKKIYNCSEIVKPEAFLLRAVTHGDFNHPSKRTTASIQWLMSIKYLIVHYDCIAD